VKKEEGAEAAAAPPYPYEENGLQAYRRWQRELCSEFLVRALALDADVSPL
jgi:hypothetical protein